MSDRDRYPGAGGASAVQRLVSERLAPYIAWAICNKFESEDTPPAAQRILKSVQYDGAQQGDTLHVQLVFERPAPLKETDYAAVVQYLGLLFKSSGSDFTIRPCAVQGEACMEVAFRGNAQELMGDLPANDYTQPLAGRRP